MSLSHLLHESARVSLLIDTLLRKSRLGGALVYFLGLRYESLLLHRGLGFGLRSLPLRHVAVEDLLPEQLVYFQFRRYGRFFGANTHFFFGAAFWSARRLVRCLIQVARRGLLHLVQHLLDLAILERREVLLNVVVGPLLLDAGEASAHRYVEQVLPLHRVVHLGRRHVTLGSRIRGEAELVKLRSSILSGLIEGRAAQSLRPAGMLTVEAVRHVLRHALHVDWLRRWSGLLHTRE